jgi:hypothetical protein
MKKLKRTQVSELKKVMMKKKNEEKVGTITFLKEKLEVS